MPQPNRQLVLLVEEARLSHYELARLVREALARRGLPAKCTHHNVRRWCEGRATRAVPPFVIAEVLSGRLGREITPWDTGLAAGRHAPACVAVFLDSPAEITATARAMWACDLGDSDSLQLSLPAPALAAPALRWLVASAPFGPTGAGGPDAPAITDALVDNIRYQSLLFDTLAQRQGGGAARASAVQYLHTHLGPLLTGRFDGTTGRDLFDAAALATWTTARHTADTPLHGWSRRYSVLALSMAHQAGDRLLGAQILVSLSHHLLGAGDTGPALDLIRAAQLAVERDDSPPFAELFAVEALAHTDRGDGTAALLALAAAEKALATARPDAPDWLTFGAGELLTLRARCQLALGRFADAAQAAQGALDRLPPGQLRTATVARLLLSGALCRLGRHEAADVAAEQALALAEGLSSQLACTQLGLTAVHFQEVRGGSDALAARLHAAAARLALAPASTPAPPSAPAPQSPAHRRPAGPQTRTEALTGAATAFPSRKVEDTAANLPTCLVIDVPSPPRPTHQPTRPRRGPRG